MTRGQWVFVGMKALLAIALWVWIMSKAAFGHDWYDPECCSGQDCAMVVPERVTAVPGGWRVQLSEGDHFMVSAPVDQVVPYGEVMVSQDEDFHVCVVLAKVRCLYAPLMGV